MGAMEGVALHLVQQLTDEAARISALKGNAKGPRISTPARPAFGYSSRRSSPYTLRSGSSTGLTSI